VETAGIANIWDMGIAPPSVGVWVEYPWCVVVHVNDKCNEKRDPWRQKIAEWAPTPCRLGSIV